MLIFHSRKELHAKAGDALLVKACRFCSLLNTIIKVFASSQPRFCRTKTQERVGFGLWRIKSQMLLLFYVFFLSTIFFFSLFNIFFR